MRGVQITPTAEERRFIRNFWLGLLLVLAVLGGLYQLAVMISPILVGVTIVVLFIVVGGLAIGAGVRRGNGQ